MIFINFFEHVLVRLEKVNIKMKIIKALVHAIENIFKKEMLALISIILKKLLECYYILEKVLVVI